MTPPNPSEAAREAAIKCAATILKEAAIHPGHSEHHWKVAGISGERMAEIIESAISQSIAEREQRIKVLEDALRLAEKNLSGWCDAIETVGAGWDDWDEYYKDARYDRSGRPSVLSIIRAALAATEGAQYPRVETK